MCGAREKHQRTHKPKSSCLATGLACLDGGPLLPKNTKTATLPLKTYNATFLQRGTDNMCLFSVCFRFFSTSESKKTRKNTCQRLFANQTLSFSFAFRSSSVISHANRACAETQTRSRSTHLLAKTPSLVMCAFFTHLGPRIYLNVKRLFCKVLLLHTWYTSDKSSCCFVLFVVFLTLTDSLRIQPWSQDRRNQTKSNRESEISRESRQKRTDKKVASKEHRRDKIENTNKNT